jgi:DNA invertase Pin-like site-specific DNA recombinase
VLEAIMSDRRVAALYIRTPGGAAVSDRRAPGVNHNSQEQGAGLRRHLAERGWDVVAVYNDHAISNRVRWPQFDALRADARSGEFDAVVINHLGQITRTVPDLLEMLDEFDSLGIGLVAVEDDIDTTEAATRDTICKLVAALLRAERMVRSERSSAALAGARSTGTRSGRTLGRPRLQIDRDRIRALRDQGRSYNQIAERVGVSVSLVRRELAKSHKNTEPIPTPDDGQEAELGVGAPTIQTQPGQPAHSDGTCPVLKIRATQAGMGFGNAPYCRQSDGQRGRP